MVKDIIKDLVEFYGIFVSTGAICGGVYLGAYKYINIWNEPNLNFNDKPKIKDIIDISIRGTYNISRVGLYMFIGYCIGGLSALGAPVVIPFYHYYLRNEKKEDNN
jgi:hypothetical protein